MSLITFKMVAERKIWASVGAAAGSAAVTFAEKKKTS